MLALNRYWFVIVASYVVLLAQLYERRMKYVKSEAEGKIFEEIDESYMTEESPSESDNEIVRRHEFQWRSSGKFSYYYSITCKSSQSLPKFQNSINWFKN